MDQDRGKNDKDKIEHTLMRERFLEACVRLKDAQTAIHDVNVFKGFYGGDIVDVKDFHVLRLLTRIISEVGEFLGYYSAVTSTSSNLSKELADIVITTLDLAQFLNLDVGSSMISKMLHDKDRGFRHGKRL